MWNPRTHTLQPHRPHTHRDWRYRVTVNGLTVYRRQGFCTYERAVASACRSLPKVAYALDQQP